jgi:hypothetical protein
MDLARDLEQSVMSDERFQALGASLVSSGGVTSEFEGRRFRDPIQAADTLVDKISEWLQKFTGGVNVPSKDEVLKLTSDLVRKYIWPFNIPYVPEFAEKTIVDPAIEKLILGSVSQVYDRLFTK